MKCNITEQLDAIARELGYTGKASDNIVEALERIKANVTGGSDFDLADRLAAGTGTNSIIAGEVTGVSANVASGEGSYAEGRGTTASGLITHAEGLATTASGDYSHAEGNSTNATGDCSHAEGLETVATGDYSHAEGEGTVASSPSQHVFGKFNTPDALGTYAEIVGNGTALDPSNARTLDWSGNEALAGSLTLGKGTVSETTITASQLAALIAMIPA